ncbi:MAG: polyphosphate kinase 1 [Gemmataceae bacterium]|nr:polyphosphate kinase 1 [Gemmataceae bacterium]
MNLNPSNLASTMDLDNPALYLNRELSWLEFNRRVLEEGKDAGVPLLERLKFLAILESNLDEFFMVRVGGLQQKLQAGVALGSGADRTPVGSLMDQVSLLVLKMTQESYQCFHEDICPALEKEGIRFIQPPDFTLEDKPFLADFFQREVFPVLTPLAIDPVHPFPHLSNKSLNLVVSLQRPRTQEKLMAVVQVPAVLPRFVSLPTTNRENCKYACTPLESVIRTHLPDLFPGMIIDHATVFRVTRNSDFEIEDEEVEDLLKTIEEEIRKRRRGMAVRLQIESDATPEVELFLVRSLGLETADVFRSNGPIDLTGLFQIHGLPGFSNLHEPQFLPQLAPDFSKYPAPWQAIRAKDILLHHPYESFSHTADFIEEAAKDDRVLAIKLTLYRTSSDSPIVRSLQRAADNGKAVTAVIELKARLDEERNVLWARELEKAGVHVVFGFVGLKTHCKVALVVRREDDGIRRYVHLSTGNYNHQTARIYTDLGYFTCNNEFCEDASALFNYLTGYCELPRWKKLVVAPSKLQDFMLEQIGRETALAKEDKPARIVAKINGLLEPVIVKALYRASQAGVKIDIVCRGICNLRPGIPGISSNIRVTSIIDRFLEHSRIYYFENEGNPLVYIGSSDWMDRNLSRRVEVIFPIEPPDLKARVIHEILENSLKDNVKARELDSAGGYKKVVPSAEAGKLRSQDKFMELAMKNAQHVFTDPPPGEITPISNETPGRRKRTRRKT